MAERGVWRLKRNRPFQWCKLLGPDFFLSAADFVRFNAREELRREDQAKLTFRCKPLRPLVGAARKQGE